MPGCMNMIDFDLLRRVRTAHGCATERASYMAKGYLKGSIGFRVALRTIRTQKLGIS